MPSLSEMKKHETSYVNKMNRLSDTMQLLANNPTKESMETYAQLESEYRQLEDQLERLHELYKEQKKAGFKMNKIIVDNDDWIVKYNAETNNLNVAYFEDGHFVNDITISLDAFTGNKGGTTDGQDQT